MRMINTHKINPVNDALDLSAEDERGQGGANHSYYIAHSGVQIQPLYIDFQNGPINEVGVNGLTNEVLLAILIDRMQGFQSGPFACRENALALTKLEEAMMWLHSRTKDRMERGVEGTHNE